LKPAPKLGRSSCTGPAPKYPCVPLIVTAETVPDAGVKMMVQKSS
jgi:hypothetical protein